MSNEELIDTNQVANILKISIHAVRDYKKRGLIRIADKKGNKDLYSREDILRRHSIIKKKRRDGHTLTQISSFIEDELKKKGVV